MLKNIKIWFRDLKQGLINLKRWFPLIWKDRDWDDYYIWVILERKLTQQAEYIASKGIHLDANRDAERMMTCVRLIRKIIDEYYRMEYMDYHKSEYHFDPVPDRSDSKQLRVEELWEDYDSYFKKYPRVYKEIVSQLEKKQKKSKSIIAMRMAWENHKRAKNVLFKMLDEHIESWWN